MIITKSKINYISYETIGCAIKVHKALGPGLLESVYHEALFYELKKFGFEVKSEVFVPIVYDGKILSNRLRIDLLVENLLIIELKAVEELIKLHEAQLLTYLKLSEKPKGLIINFNCSNITEEGLISLVGKKFSELSEN